MPQEGEMVLAPGDNVVELGKVSQKQGKTRTRDLSEHKITLIRPLT
jgi:hypothetical protein